MIKGAVGAAIILAGLQTHNTLAMIVTTIIGLSLTLPALISVTDLVKGLFHA